MAFASSRAFRFGLYGLAVFILGASMYSLARPSIVGTIPSASSSDHVKGISESSVTLVEYSDFQCPACAAFQPVVTDLMNTYGDRITFVYRHFPLVTLHANAEAAGRAAEAASAQGKFWEMHDMLFDRQTDWANLADPTPMFVAYAELLELNTEQFSSDLASDAVRARVRTDMTSGDAANISATPTFFLNGEALTFPKDTHPLDYLTAQIDAALVQE